MKNCQECKSEVPKEYEICWNCSYNFTTKKIDGFVSDKIKLQSDSIKPKQLNCLRCKTTMKFEDTIKFHEGSNWGVIGDLGHVFTNKKSFDLYMCPNCDKIEFFAPTINRAH